MSKYLNMTIISIALFTIIYYVSGSDTFEDCLFLSMTTQVSLGTATLEKFPKLKKIMMLQILSVIYITATCFT